MSNVTKEVSYVSVNFASNGGFVEYSGRDDEGDYVNAKEVFTDITEALDTVRRLYETCNEYK